MMSSPLVFISYSQKDGKLMRELVTHLFVLEQMGNIQLWDDTKIDIGEFWFPAIEDAISQAKVALLLVTANFLSSPFIEREEIPRLLARQANDGLVIIPIIATACLWEAVPWLREINIPNRGKPIWERPPAKRARALKVIAANVLDIVKNKNISKGIIEPELIHIPDGSFQMGADMDSTKVKVFNDETPLHTVDLPAFFISKFPTTNRQYHEFVIDTNFKSPPDWTGNEVPHNKLNHPVVNISWYEAIAYCRWLTENTGRYYRLPSEAEWEKAARGRNYRIFPWGNTWKPDHCNSREAGINNTSPVDKYDSGISKYGIYDMSGNVSEWTITLWSNPETKIEYRYPYSLEDGREILDGDWDLPQSLREEFTARVLRGGSFIYQKSFSRCSFRRRLAPQSSGVDIGFRVAVTPHLV